MSDWSADVAPISDEAQAALFLYGLDPADFVAARTAVVKRLRAAKDRDTAEAVKRLKKPSLLAAELNHVIRTMPAELERLLAAAAALRDGHRSMLAGEPIDLAALQADHRDGAAAIAATARRDRDRIAAILEAVSLDEACHEPLQTGTFAVDPNPASGFDLFAGVPVAEREATVTSLDRARRRRKDRGDDSPPPADDPRPPSADTRAKLEQAPRRRRKKRGEARLAVASIEAATAKAEDAVRLAKRRSDAAAKKQAKAVDRVDELERRLADAQDHLADTERAARAATEALKQAEQRLTDVTADPRATP